MHRFMTGAAKLILSGGLLVLGGCSEAGSELMEPELSAAVDKAGLVRPVDVTGTYVYCASSDCFPGRTVNVSWTIRNYNSYSSTYSSSRIRVETRYQDGTPDVVTNWSNPVFDGYIGAGATMTFSGQGTIASGTYPRDTEVFEVRVIDYTAGRTSAWMDPATVMVEENIYAGTSVTSDASAVTISSGSSRTLTFKVKNHSNGGRYYSLSASSSNGIATIESVSPSYLHVGGYQTGSMSVTVRGGSDAGTATISAVATNTSGYYHSDSATTDVTVERRTRTVLEPR